MGYNPLVSIITVCYNSEKHIRDTIESVLNQSYDNIEYVIVDGESTDNTINIIKEYEPRFKGKMRWVSEPDEGIYDAMNKGIGLCNGEIIGIINSDDWYELYAVEKIVDKLKESNAGVVYGDMYMVIPETSERYILTGNISSKKINKLRINHPTVFVKKTIYDDLGMFDTNFPIAADFDIILRFLSNNINFIRLPYTLANFRLSGLSSKIDLNFQLRVLLNKYKILKKNNVSIYKRAYITTREFLLMLRNNFIYTLIGQKKFNSLRRFRYQRFRHT